MSKFKPKNRKKSSLPWIPQSRPLGLPHHWYENQSQNGTKIAKSKKKFKFSTMDRSIFSHFFWTACTFQIYFEFYKVLLGDAYFLYISIGTAGTKMARGY